MSLQPKLLTKSFVTPNKELTLTLFMARVGANDVNAALAAYDFTVLTNSLHTGADFHRRFSRIQKQTVKRKSI